MTFNFSFARGWFQLLRAGKNLQIHLRASKMGHLPFHRVSFSPINSLFRESSILPPKCQDVYSSKRLWGPDETGHVLHMCSLAHFPIVKRHISWNMYRVGISGNVKCNSFDIHKIIFGESEFQGNGSRTQNRKS